MKNCLILLPLAILLAGCVTSEYEVRTNPANAKISVIGQPPAQVVQKDGTTKVLIPSGNQSHTIQATLQGYAPATYVVQPGTKLVGPIKLDLQSLSYKKPFNIASSPEGAEVLVDGKVIGKTPLSCELVFYRKDATSQWDKREVSVRMADWQSESVPASSTSATDIVITLSCLRQARTFTIKAVTADGQTIDAPVTVGGKVVGKTPIDVTLVFERADKTQGWPVFKCSTGIVDEYVNQEFTITRESPDSLKFTLEPVSEMGVARMLPTVTMGARGAQYVVDKSARNSTVDTRETSGTVAELRQVTAFGRGDHRNPEVNSFAIAPNGQNIVYALSETEAEGTTFSNLWQSSTDVANGARQRLTMGQYLDTLPQLPIGEGPQQMLVFQSNRGMRDSSDLSYIRLVDGHTVGGITQITREARFNSSPVLMREEWELFFVSTEDHYPQAVPQIGYMRTDGSSPTYMNESGTDLAVHPTDRRIFFVRKDSTTGMNQIYSMPMEGFPLTQVISQEAFTGANCYQPALNPEGNLMLFVSDQARDDKGRRNSDIYLMNLTTGKIIPVTTNVSDDVSPAWSPVDPGVIYFLSNRGGCYNVWRLRLTDVQ